MKKALPKQWKNWCECAGLKINNKRSAWAHLNITGFGRRWRIVGDEIHCSCEEEAFDRWANSRSVTAPMATTRASFVRIVWAMNRKAKEIGNDWQPAVRLVDERVGRNDKKRSTAVNN